MLATLESWVEVRKCECVRESKRLRPSSKVDVASRVSLSSSGQQTRRVLPIPDSRRHCSQGQKVLEPVIRASFRPVDVAQEV